MAEDLRSACERFVRGVTELLSTGAPEGAKCGVDALKVVVERLEFNNWKPPTCASDPGRAGIDAALAGAQQLISSTPCKEEMHAVADSAIMLCRHAQRYTNPNIKEKLGAGFLSKYSSFEVVGHSGLWPFPSLDGEAANVRLGLVVLGSDMTYPPHHHPAAELYLVLAGEALWQRDDEEYEPVPPGCFRFHPCWMSHAMKTNAEPLLACYLWWGDTSVVSDIIS